MGKTYRVTFPVTVTVQEGVNWEKPLCGYHLDEMDRDGIISAAESVLCRAVDHGTTPYLRNFMTICNVNPGLLRNGCSVREV